MKIQPTTKFTWSIAFQTLWTWSLNERQNSNHGGTSFGSELQWPSLFFCHSYDQDHHAFHDQQYLKLILVLWFVSCIVNASLKNPNFFKLLPFRQLILKLNAYFAKHILNVPHSTNLIQTSESSIIKNIVVSFDQYEKKIFRNKPQQPNF